MDEHQQAWEYCNIKFQLRYKGEVISIMSGMKTVWLVFRAVASGQNQNRAISEAEIPIAGNVAGASFVPQKNISGHVNIHQNLLQTLQKDGWELLPEKGSAWWERRLRRPAQAHASVMDRLKSWVAA
jgi:hypothetical protein